MTGAENSERQVVISKLKDLLIQGLRLDMSPEQIGDTAPIFGAEGLGLDSIDALELVVLIEEHFNVSIPDEDAGRQAFASLGVLAEYILAERGRW